VSGIDLSALAEAAELAFTDSGWRQQRDDETRWVAYEAVRAVAPLIEAQATRLEPWESMALTVATAQLNRGEEPTPNVAAVCIGALERIARGTS